MEQVTSTIAAMTNSVTQAVDPVTSVQSLAVTLSPKLALRANATLPASESILSVSATIIRLITTPTPTPTPLTTTSHVSSCSFQYAADPTNPGALGAPTSTVCPKVSLAPPSLGSALGVGLGLGLVAFAAILTIIIRRYRSRRPSAYHRLDDGDEKGLEDPGLPLQALSNTRAMQPPQPDKYIETPVSSPPQLSLEVGSGARRLGPFDARPSSSGASSSFSTPTRKSLDSNPFTDSYRMPRLERSPLSQALQGPAMPVHARPSILRLQSIAASVHSDETFLPESRSSTPPTALRAYRAYTPPETRAASGASTPADLQGSNQSSAAWPMPTPFSRPLRPPPRPMSTTPRAPRATISGAHPADLSWGSAHGRSASASRVPLSGLASFGKAGAH
jgi:hypothetical protein